jgi:RNA polymerase sigma-70 factor (family 1)
MNRDARLAELQHRIAEMDDQHAYEEMFLTYAPALIHFAGSIVQSPELAEEIVSDVFMRIWEKRKTLDHIHNLRFYLYAATRNFAINQLRATQRNPTLALEEMQTDFDDKDASPAEQAISRDMYRHLQEAINELPPRCRVIFKLAKQDGLKQKEIAELLHVSLKTVENQLAIALKKLSQRVMAFRSATTRH